MDKIYKLSDLLDLAAIKKMADAHYRTAGMPVGIIDAYDGTILVAAGWQEICSMYHRVNPETGKRCRESDDYIKSHLVEGEACSYKCINGMWDIGMPIIACGQHLATMFIGQFFYDDEIPDRSFFIGQAERFGFDVEGYLAALDRVPVLSREKVDSIVEYNKAMVTFISDLASHALLNLKVEEAGVQYVHFMQTLLDAIPNPIFYKDVNGIYRGCNNAFEAYLGAKKSDIIGKSVYDMAPKKLADIYCEMDNALLSQGGVQVYESSIRYADGTLHDVIFNKATYTNVDGTLGGLVGVILDITERKQVEEALRESEKRLSQIIDFLPDATFAIDLNGNVIAWNRAIEEMTGVKAEEMLGKGDYEYGIPFYGLRRPILIDLVFRSDEEIKNKYFFVRKEGDYLLAEADVPVKGDKHVLWGIARPLFDSKGNSVGAIESIRDITEFKHAEEERSKLEMLLRQAQKMDAIGTLAGGIAHDFNNILTALIGYGSILQSKLSNDDPLKKYADNILSSSEKAASLTQSLLTFSRSQSMDIKPQKINAIVRGMESLLHRLLSEDLELRIHLSDQELTIMADISQIDQVLMNLATNARDAMPGGGTLTIETRQIELDSEFIRMHGFGVPGNYVLLSVSDTGTGMDEKTRQKIFEPFFTTKVVGKGTGLGLAIVYGIVKQHNGYINIYSEPGEGTAVHIYLPLVTAEVADLDSAVSEIVGGSETVLVVEDDADSRKLLKEVLDSKGYAVIEAVDGLDAINRFSDFKDSIDLIVMDVVMPKKNGVEVYNEIKQIRPDIKILFMSGYTGDVVFEKGIHDHFNFVSKPISPNALLIRIREILGDHVKS